MVISGEGRSHCFPLSSFRWTQNEKCRESEKAPWACGVGTETRERARPPYWCAWTQEEEPRPGSLLCSSPLEGAPFNPESLSRYGHLFSEAPSPPPPPPLAVCVHGSCLQQQSQGQASRLHSFVMDPSISFPSRRSLICKELPQVLDS